MPLSQPALMQLTTFDCSVSSCYDPNEELRLRHVIDAIGTERFELKIRQLGQLILDRELTRSRGLLVDAVLGTASEDIEKLPTEPIPALPEIPVASVSSVIEINEEAEEAVISVIMDEGLIIAI